MVKFSLVRIFWQIITLLCFISFVPVLAQAEPTLVLSETGSYLVGTRTMHFRDESREDWEIEVTLWYPASEASENAAPDQRDAPYPLIIYSHGGQGSRREMAYLAEHLVSYGFIFVALEHPSDAVFPPYDIVDRPMDVLFVLNQLANIASGDLLGIIDTDTVGVSGHSEGGLTTLELTGAQFDLYYAVRDWCAEYPETYPRICLPEHFIDDIRDYRSQFEPPVVADEIWPSYYDERIKAALAFAGGPGMLFGETGFASALVPTLIMAGTADEFSPYEWAAVYPYEHMISAERYLISVIGGDHYFGAGLNPPYRTEVLHFATAFFGYYLQGREDYAVYLTEDYVNSIENLVWGVYDAEAAIQTTEVITATNIDQLTELATFALESWSLAFSPDGTMLAYGGAGLYGLTTGVILPELNSDMDFVKSLAFSPDGRMLAVADDTQQFTVQVWDMARREIVLQLDDFPAWVYSLAFNHDGTILATGWGDFWGWGPGSVKLWDTTTGTLVAELGLPSGDPAMMLSVFGVAFSPDGSLLAAAHGNGSVLLWDMANEREYAVLEACESYAYAVAFSPDGTLLATAGAGGRGDLDSDLRLFSVATTEQMFTLESDSEAVTAVAFNHDGTVLASVAMDGTVRLWDTRNGEMLSVLAINSATDIAFSPDGKLLAVQEGSGVRIWGVRALS